AYGPSLASALNNLGNRLSEVGRLHDALAVAEEAVAIYSQVAATSPAYELELAASRSNLAGAYLTAGQIERAMPLYEQTLADSVRVLGEDHPDTLLARNNLAGAYALADDVEKAIALYERTLADRRRVLGISHPDTLTSQSNLASAYALKGDLARAVALYEKTVTQSVQILGEGHPMVQNMRNNLMYWREKARAERLDLSTDS
ncbi:tetratricopeptide repeat protein, partial [Streptomyces sp. NPDC057966]|uniref:tetratricopeptide repeat protein n=1 Tax=Streptomyces sp. NPDC057966 TaxID=3346292 RepID=UPI0036F0987D